MVRYDSGFSFNGKHTFYDWGFTLKNREIGYPDKKKNTYTVPHSNNVIDFSALYGFQTYEQREIKYVLNVADINFNDPNTVNTYEMRLTNWLMQGVGQMWLVDDVFPTFHFLAEVVNGTSFKQIGANGELTISFVAYPFKIGNEFEGNDIWDTFNFDFDVSQNTTHEFRIEWDSFKPVAVGKWVHLGDWATDFSSGSDISPILMGQTYQISEVRNIEKQSASLREYKLVGINNWVLEQDIVEAHNSYYDLTIINNGTNAVAPEVVIQTGRALTAVDNNGEYFNIVNQPTNSSSFKLHPGINKIRLYGQLGNYKVDFKFRKELL